MPQQPIVPSNGLNMDISDLNRPSNVLSYCLNCSHQSNSQEGNEDKIGNEASNYLAINFPTNFKVIGKLPIYEQNRVVFFLVRPETGESLIGEVLNCYYNDDSDDYPSVVTCGTCEFPTQNERPPLETLTQTPYCTYRTITSGNCLNFKINFPIRSEYKITDCGLDIYFTDNTNQRRYLYFVYNESNQLVIDNKFKVITGYTSDDCHEAIYSEVLDCNKINYHPIHESPCLELVDVISGGSLRAGTYQFIPYYSDSNGLPLGNPLPTTNPIPIFTKEVTFDTNYTTDRAIALKFTNLSNLVYDYYTLIVAETVDGFTSFKQAGVYNTLQSKIIYTGNEENLKKLTPNDVFFRNPYYNTAANVTSANDYLFFSELTEFPKPNLQRVANKIKLNWQTVAIPEAAYKDPKNTYFFKTYNRDEVYPMGAIFITENGEELGPFHIPGPSKQDFLDNSINVDQIISNNDVIDRVSCLEADVNCCQPLVTNSQTATISFSCSDRGCTEEGIISIDIVFPTITTEDLTIYLGILQRYPAFSTPTYIGTGTSIMGTLPTDTNLTIGNPYGDPAQPFAVIVPAGSTSFHSERIIQINNDDLFHKTGVCHTCLFPVVEAWLKVQSPQTTILSFNNNQGVIIHNVLNPEPTPTDCVDCSANLQSQRWQVYNTGFVIGAPHQHFVNCDNDSIWEWGQFAYWQSTELYPNNEEKWGELCGKPIRHHKFPDSLVTHIHDGLSATKGFNDNNIVFPIGILVNHQSVKDALTQAVTDGLISQADKNRIKEYRIIRGNRVGNESIVAKGLLFDMWNYSKDNVTYYYPNYPYNDLHPDNFISPTRSTYSGSTTSDPIPSTFNKTSRYTFHSPNVHFTNKAIGTELKLEALEYGESEGFFNKAEEQAKYRFLSTFAATLAFGAGLAAAFSAEKEKQCKQITIKAEEATTIGITGGVTQTFGDLQLYTAGATWEYDEFFNVPSPLKPNPLASQVTYNTCKGTPLQLLSVTSGNPAGILTGGILQPAYLLIMGLKQMQIVRDLIKVLLPLKNLSIQYNSVGRYSNYLTVGNTGNKIRKISRGAYLDPIVQTVNEAIDVQGNQFSTIPINNHERERSVYLKIDNSKPLPNPSVQDNSRFTLNQAGLSQGDLGKRVYRNVSSYYASIKNYVPDQYGRISDIEYLETDSCAFSLAKTYLLEELSRFGGDTFINRFAHKRKMPFFLQTRFKQIDEIDVQYSELGNVGYPNYYFNSDEELLERFSEFNFSLSNLGSFYQALINVNKSRLDAKTSKAFYQSGFAHLYNYGIPYFFTESDINVDYRHGQNNLEKDFYPHQGDLNFWLQEKNVPITEDNYYFYNNTYSKQNKENVIGIEKDSNDYTKDCRIDHKTRIIVSDRGNNDSISDEFLRFRGDNFYDFPASKGAIISIDGIENDKVLVRFENGSQIFGAYDTLQTDSGTIAVGNAGMFQSRPKEFSNTKLGFAGSQHTDLLQTEYGHIWVDAKRGQIFNLAPNANGLDELAKDGMQNWFKENLPFQLLRDFPTLSLKDINNNFKGIGISLSFDKRFGRIFITKLDYKKVDPTIVYDKALKIFKKGNTVVELSDKRYFCNKAWTVSYKFSEKFWSFHSFTPNYYIDQLDYFQSGYNSNQSTLWSHNISNKSYQVYNGRLQPYIVEMATSPQIQNTTLHSIEFETEAIRYHNLYDTAFSPYVTFNKAVLYNERQSSGPLNLNIRDENNLYQSLQYPKVINDERHVLLTNKEGKWRLNDFYDAVNSPSFNQPLFLYDCSNATKQVNLKALNLFKPDNQQPMMRAKQTRIRLIQDKHSNEQIILNFSTTKNQPSII